MRVKISRTTVFIQLMTLVPFVCLLASFSVYHLPGINTIIYIIAFVSLGLVGGIQKDVFDFSKKQSVVFYFLCFIFPVFTSLLFFRFPNIGYLLGLIYACIFFLLRDEYRFRIYHYFIKGLAFLLLLSIVEYIVYHVTGFVLHVGNVTRQITAGSVEFEHALFNMFQSWSFRFQSLADEPGRIGTLCGFLLFTTNLTYYKKEYIVFLISGLLSFSFAFYVLLGIYLLAHLKSRWGSVLVILVVMGGVYWVVDEQVNQYIIDRYEGQEYDNRISTGFKAEFHRFVKSGEVFFGNGFGATDEGRWNNRGGNAGVKRELYDIGLVGLFFIVIGYSFLFIRFNGVHYQTLVLLMVIWISYYQRSDGNFTPNIIIFFAYQLADVYYQKLKIKYVLSS